MLARNAEFDWYQSTVMVQCPEASGLVARLLEAWPLTDWVPAKNLNGYTRGGAIVRNPSMPAVGTNLLCHLCWGGQPGVNCKSTSDQSPVLAKALRGFTHLPTRIDSKVDWCEVGLFDSLSSHLIQYAKDNRLGINQMGDWERGEARTLYVGSKDSPIRAVLYEKGYEQGADAPREWVRLEVRIKPKREWRPIVASWKPDTVFCAGWLPGALEALGWDDLEKRTIGTTWKRSDHQRALWALASQYGSVLTELADDLGDWRLMGEALYGLIRDVAEHRSAGKEANAGASAASIATGAAPTSPSLLGNTTNFTDKKRTGNRTKVAS